MASREPDSTGEIRRAIRAIGAKEQFVDRLINMPGWIVLAPSGLIIEWGSATVAGGAGIAQTTHQKLTNGHFPWVIVVLHSGPGIAAGTLVSCSIKDLLIVGPAISYRIDVRKQTAGATANQADGNIIMWLAVGY